jgi:twitching motility protein PilI
MVPDAASFLADMPFLEGGSAVDAAAPPAEGGAPDQAAENMIPDSTAFLMDGFAAEGDGSLPDAGTERPVALPQVAAAAVFAAAPDFSSEFGLLAPSAALGSSHVDLREGLAGTWGVDRNRTSSAKLGFHVGDLRFVVSFDDASELSEMVSVYRLPNVPAWFRGLANLHGNLVPVFDVAAMIGSQTKAKAGAEKDRMLLVLGHGAMAAGMLVNELPTRIRLESATAIDLPELPDELKDCVPKAYLHGEEIWLELQYQRFFEATAARLAS